MRSVFLVHLTDFPQRSLFAEESCFRSCRPSPSNHYPQITVYQMTFLIFNTTIFTTSLKLSTVSIWQSSSDSNQSEMDIMCFKHRWMTFWRYWKRILTFEWIEGNVLFRSVWELLCSETRGEASDPKFDSIAESKARSTKEAKTSRSSATIVVIDRCWCISTHGFESCSEYRLFDSFSDDSTYDQSVIVQRRRSACAEEVNWTNSSDWHGTTDQ